MAQTTSIVQALKQTLKIHGKRYSDVAKALGLSEASVKRLFAEEQFSLKRLDQICNYLGIEITDILSSMRDETRIQSLTEEQEKLLVEDIPLLLVANAALNRWIYEDILSTYDFSETELVQYLAKLDRLRLIQLLPLTGLRSLLDMTLAGAKVVRFKSFLKLR